MQPTKAGQIVKYHTTFENENPEQQYVVLEIHLKTERPRALIQAINTGLSFPPTSTVMVSDLKVVEVDTSDLLGHAVTIQKSDFSEVSGVVTKIQNQKIALDLSKGLNGVETNVWLTIMDKFGNEQTGTLLVR